MAAPYSNLDLRIPRVTETLNTNEDNVNALGVSTRVLRGLLLAIMIEMV